MHSRHTTSRCGRMHHPRRQDVLTYYLNAQLRETAATLEDFAIAFVHEYLTRVPDHAQTLNIEELDERGMSVREFATALGRIRKRIQRWRESENALPAEAEEAWAYALTPPYGERCRHELAWRYGFMGAMSPEADPFPDTEVMGRLLSHTGSATSALGRALADHQFDYDDVSDGQIEAELATLQADIGGLLARVRAVRSAGTSGANVTPQRDTSDGR